jgi:hypothetical protein
MHNHKFLVFQWDCWKEENSINSEPVKKLNFYQIIKYTGKIYMNKKNGSPTWYVITYYAFDGHIKHKKKVWNRFWIE